VGRFSGWLIAYAAYASLVAAPLDLVAFTLVPLLLLAIAAVASWLPAQRVSGVNPLPALRYQ
jgi:ABC-type lipoprotein release transport system permease subunit